jgi:hypothetical protein
MLDDPTPIRVAGTCAAAVRSGAGGSWRSCMDQPVLAADWLEPHTGKLWLIFLCELHRDLVEDTRPLTDADTAELHDRRDAVRRALSGQPWDRPRPAQTQARGRCDTRSRREGSTGAAAGSGVARRGDVAQLSTWG